MEIPIANIPRDLRDRPHWLLWRWEEREGRRTKVPIGIDGRRTDVTDSESWFNFDLAWQYRKASARSRNSTMVTLLPKFEKMVANSSPITPPPTMVNDSGSLLIEINRLLLTTEGSFGLMKGGISGCDPVEMIMLSPLNSIDSPV